ncbi:MAG: hypothetical protein MUE73_17575 [Planctomycetes bacterium]|jgi:hypothetical protein|nr:hypothetical protein [Planctomycetota bacterium]
MPRAISILLILLATSALPVFAVTNVGIRFTVPEEPAGINDLHVDFKSVGSVTDVEHIPNPPAPASDVSWPVVSYGGDTVDFSGVAVTAGQTTSYRFVFSLTGLIFGDDWKTQYVQSATWTRNGKGVADAKPNMTLVAYE